MIQYLRTYRSYLRQRKAWRELERRREAWLRSYAGQDYIKRRAAALKGLGRA